MQDNYVYVGRAKRKILKAIEELESSELTGKSKEELLKEYNSL